MNFGGPTDEVESLRLIGRCRDAGINFIDTTNTYNGGRLEEIVGCAIVGDHDLWVLATEVNGSFGTGVSQRGSSRKGIAEKVQMDKIVRRYSCSMALRKRMKL
jgi:aryl-alcohol dehydrogenase-like predicted oxidoreductase